MLLQRLDTAASVTHASSYMTEGHTCRAGNSTKFLQNPVSLPSPHELVLKKDKTQTMMTLTKKIFPLHVSSAANRILTPSSQNVDTSFVKHVLSSDTAKTLNVQHAVLPQMESSTKQTRSLPNQKQSVQKRRRSEETLMVLKAKRIQL